MEIQGPCGASPVPHWPQNSWHAPHWILEPESGCRPPSRMRELTPTLRRECGRAGRAQQSSVFKLTIIHLQGIPGASIKPPMHTHRAIHPLFAEGELGPFQGLNITNKPTTGIGVDIFVRM